MSGTATKKTPDETEAEAPARKAVIVHEEHVWQNKAGARFCQWDSVAPEGATFDDLLDPAVWKRVQEIKRPSLRQGDEIRITGFDRSWVVWCFVSHATGNGIILARFADTNPSGPREHLFEDDLYIVRWVGSGYGVYRKTDDQRMNTQTLLSAAHAESALRALYPASVA